MHHPSLFYSKLSFFLSLINCGDLIWRRKNITKKLGRAHTFTEPLVLFVASKRLLLEKKRVGEKALAVYALASLYP